MRISETHGEIPDLTLQELSELVAPVAAMSNITGVSLFGSRARGDYDLDSDYDFLIDVNDDYRFRDYLRFKDTMSDLLKCDVDVISRRSLKGDRFSQDVLREEIRIYG